MLRKESDWPAPYIYTVCDRIFGDFSAKNTVHTPYIYTVCAGIFGESPAKNIVYTRYIYGPGQPQKRVRVCACSCYLTLAFLFCAVLTCHSNSAILHWSWVLSRE